MTQSQAIEILYR